ncbi:MAG: DUF4184 family protein [Chitinophagales bacterium]|nr:DUF4184 family protein [Chitinophagales bacterium]
MDIITHTLTGINTYRWLPRLNNKLVLAAAVLPDLGEVVIQRSLCAKNNAAFGVYDARTSDASIAGNLEVTMLYDATHSLAVCLLILLSGFIVRNKTVALASKSIAVGMFTHFLLDSCTHGRVWALKIFFPFSNERIPILSNTLGNWWDWQPQFAIPYLGIHLPLVCLAIWGLLLVSLILNYKYANNKN